MSTSKWDFKTDEVCRILEACMKGGVSKLKLGPLEVEFGRQASPSFEPSPLPMAMAEPNHERQNAEAIETEELRTKERQIEELLITDPLAAEELIRSGELEEDVGRDEDFEEA